MDRRELLAGIGALGVVGAGAATVFTDFDITDPAGSNQAAGAQSTGFQSVDLPRFDAPGSPPGTETVPERGRVSFVTFFATWCGICRRKMEPLGEAYESVGDDVQFVSVTNEPVGQTIEPEEVVAWWREYDGQWPVAHDADLELTRAVDAPGVPYSLVFDADNVLAWSDAGYKDAETILQQIRDAR